MTFITELTALHPIKNKIIGSVLCDIVCAKLAVQIKVIMHSFLYQNKLPPGKVSWRLLLHPSNTRSLHCMPCPTCASIHSYIHLFFVLFADLKKDGVLKTEPKAVVPDVPRSPGC